MIPLDEIRRARERLGDDVLRTPLVQLDENVWLKLENLQPIGSFKLRGALSAIRAASADELAGGVVTASAGNMAQGVAWAAREAGVRARIIAPDNAPQTKLDAVERLGGEVIRVPHEVWWQTMVERRYEGVDGFFVHPVEDDAVMAGNGTIGLELCEDLAAFDTVIIPWGGGGLTTGIASAVKALRPQRSRRDGRAGDGGTARGVASRRCADRDRVRDVVRRRRRRPRALADDVGARARARRRGGRGSARRRPRRRSGSSRRVPASSRRAPARSRSPRRKAARAAASAS